MVDIVDLTRDEVAPPLQEGNSRLSELNNAPEDTDIIQLDISGIKEESDIVAVNFSRNRGEAPLETISAAKRPKLSAKRKEQNQQFKAYLDQLTPEDANRVSVAFVELGKEKSSMREFRRMLLKEGHHLIDIIDRAIIDFDDACVAIRCAKTSPKDALFVAQKLKIRANAIRYQFQQQKAQRATDELSSTLRERDQKKLQNDKYYQQGRAQSLVSQFTDKTKGMYRRPLYEPDNHPTSSGSAVLNQALQDPLGRLPDGTMLSTKYLRHSAPGLMDSSLSSNGVSTSSQKTEDEDPTMEALRLEHARNKYGRMYGIDTMRQPAYQNLPLMADAENVANYEKIVDMALNTAEPLDMPPQMNCASLEHQRQGLGWLLRAERGVYHGGILADDMGLGKTVQTIALMYANLPDPETFEREKRLTLIVCPVALMETWRQELWDRVKPDHRFKVYVHHRGSGNNEYLDNYRQIASRYNVVICTYNGLSREYNELEKYNLELRKQAIDPEYQAKPRSHFKPYPLFETHWYRVVLDEAHSIKNKTSRASLAASHLTATHRLALTGTPMQNNIVELYPLLRFLKMRPYDELQRFQQLVPTKESSRYKQVAVHQSLTTVLGAILLRRKKDTVINNKKIIDNLPPRYIRDVYVKMEGEEMENYKTLEKHIQKEVNRLTSEEMEMTFGNMLVLLMRMRQAANHPFLIKVSKAANTRQVWGNNVATREAIVQAFRVNPNFREVALHHAPEERICTVCNGPATVAAHTMVMSGCGHILCSECADDHQYEENETTVCVQCGASYSYVAVLEIVEAIQNTSAGSVQEVLEVLRTLQAPRVSELNHEDQIRQLKLKQLKRDADTSMMFEADELDEMDEVVEIESYNEMENEPILLLSESDDEPGGGPDNANNALTHEDDQDFSRGMLEEQCKKKHIGKDPLKERIKIHELAKLFKVRDVFMDGWETSAKVQALLDILREIWTEAPNDKVIVFSNFTTMLDMLTIPLDSACIQYEMYTGRLNVTDRTAVLERFKNGRAKLLLTSLKAGNVGLTLTQANRVVILEPFWNPYVEDQAQDRVYRIGQSRQVTIYRLRIKETVEDRIVELQDSKRNLIESALDEGMKNKSAGLSRSDMLYALGINSGGRNENARTPQLHREYPPVRQQYADARPRIGSDV